MIGLNPDTRKLIKRFLNAAADLNVALRELRQKLAAFLGRFLGGLAPRLIVVDVGLTSQKKHPFF